MKQDKISVAALQMTPVHLNKRATVEKLCEWIVEAGRIGAKFVVTPETLIPGYPYWRGSFGYTTPETAKPWADTVVELYENAIRIPGPETDLIGKAAAQAGTLCAVGCQEQDDRPGSRTIYNTMVFVDRTGKVLGRHRKLMPTHQERFFWGMGDVRDLCVFDTEIGIIGGLICYEHHMTLVKAAMALLGEELHAACWPGWWSYVGDRRSIKDMSGNLSDPRSCDIDAAVREYAFETQTFVVSCGMYAPPESVPNDFPYKSVGNWRWAVGGSCIVNPFGAYLVEPVFNQEKIITGELDFKDRIVAKNVVDCIGHYSRPDILRLEIGPTRADAEWATGSKNLITRLEEIATQFGLCSQKIERLEKDLNKNLEG